MLTTISVVRSKPEEWQPRIKRHVEHWQKYVEYLNHIEQLFRAGRKKEDVLQAIINMHRSIKRWEEVAREQAKNPVPPVKLLKAVFLSKGGDGVISWLISHRGRKFGSASTLTNSGTRARRT